MMKKKAKVDSMNFCSSSFEYIFDSDEYKIVTVKGIGFFNPKLWLETFSKSLTKNIIEAKIIFTSMGLTIPLKRYASSPRKQTIEFAGLHGYNEESKLLKQLLIELLPMIQDSIIKRIDVCLDYERVPNKVIKRLCINRKPFQYKNTTYYKTAKEKKVNSTMDIKRYNKQIQAKLDYPLHRLEFAFKGRYFNNMKLKQLDKETYKKMEKSILKFSGIDSSITSIS